MVYNRGAETINKANAKEEQEAEIKEEKKMKRMLMVFVVLLTVVLPCSALALNSNFPVTGNYNSVAGSEAQAKRYTLAFATDEGVGHNDTWEVYSAPSLNAVRGAKGKASVHTSGGVKIGGWDGAWLLVRYEKNNGGYRVGWVPNTTINTKLKTTRSVNFAYWSVEIVENCILTDDPLLESEALANVEAGEELTYLAYYQYNEGREYAYVKGFLKDQPVCGFIPFDAIKW